MAEEVFLALQLLAKARAIGAQHPPLRQLQLLAPPPRVLQLVPLLAPPPRVSQALQLAAKAPMMQETLQQLYLPQTTQRLNPQQTTQCLNPMQTTQRLQDYHRVAVHGRARASCHTYLVGTLQCTGGMRKGANAPRHHRAMPTQ